MKNLLLLTAFLCPALFAGAQFTTGEKQIAGQFGFGYNESKIGNAIAGNSNTFNLRLSASFSRFKSPTLMKGAGIYYYYLRSHTSIGSPVDDRVQPLHSIGIFVNRTKLEPLAKRFYFTYTGAATISYQVSHPYYVGFGSGTWQDTYGVSVSAGIGLLYELNTRLLLSCELSDLLGVGYTYGVETGSFVNNTTYKNTSHSFGFTTNLTGFSLANIGIGIRYRLKK